MTADASHIAAGDRALEDYLGGLLAAPDAPQTAAATGATDAPASELQLDCLHITAAGVAIAAPREAVAALEPWPMDCQAASPGGIVGGHWSHEGRAIAVIDTARLILPPESRASLGPLAARARDVLVLADGPWALVSEAAGTPLAIAPEQVHWRGESGRRPWLAGMVADPPCALLDIAGLLDMLSAPAATQATA